jgi:hypothetical protein
MPTEVLRSLRQQENPRSSRPNERVRARCWFSTKAALRHGQGGGVPVGQEHLPGAVDLDPLQGRRSSKVLVARNRLLKSTFRPRPRVAADTIVQSLSGDADAPADCAHEKDLQMQASPRAADGIRTHDLLHGKRSVWFPVRSAISLQATVFPGPRVVLRFPGFHREFTGGWAPTGHPSWPSPRWRVPTEVAIMNRASAQRSDSWWCHRCAM